jgi:hypothetical protein
MRTYSGYDGARPHSSSLFIRDGISTAIEICELGQPQINFEAAGILQEFAKIS